MERKTKNQPIRMLEGLIQKDFGLEEISTPNASGTGTQVGFGRGGTPKKIKIIPYSGQILSSNASGTGTQVGFGRGGTPKKIGIIYYAERDNLGLGYELIEKESDKIGG